MSVFGEKHPASVTEFMIKSQVYVLPRRSRTKKGSSLVSRGIVMISKLNLVGQGEEMCPASLVRTYVLLASSVTG